jgi:hypothetical protein
MISVMIYSCPAWELAADTCLIKLQLLQSKSSAAKETLVVNLKGFGAKTK